MTFFSTRAEYLVPRTYPPRKPAATNVAFYALTFAVPIPRQGFTACHPGILVIPRCPWNTLPRFPQYPGPVCSPPREPPGTPIQASFVIADTVAAHHPFDVARRPCLSSLSRARPPAVWRPAPVLSVSLRGRPIRSGPRRRRTAPPSIGSRAYPGCRPVRRFAAACCPPSGRHRFGSSPLAACCRAEMRLQQRSLP
jgi:hypothetical protein